MLHKLTAWHYDVTYNCYFREKKKKHNKTQNKILSVLLCFFFLSRKNSLYVLPFCHSVSLTVATLFFSDCALIMLAQSSFHTKPWILGYLKAATRFIPLQVRSCEPPTSLLIIILINYMWTITITYYHPVSLTVATLFFSDGVLIMLAHKP